MYENTLKITTNKSSKTFYSIHSVLVLGSGKEGVPSPRTEIEDGKLNSNRAKVINFKKFL